MNPSGSEDGQEDQEEIAELEGQLRELEDEGYGSPHPPNKDSLFKFFRELLRSKDSKKFGNLTLRELGMTRMSVRQSLHIAQFCESIRWEKVSSYFKQTAEIDIATSLSRDGKLVELFVTQIKKEQKIKDKPEVKKTWWGGTKAMPPQED